MCTQTKLYATDHSGEEEGGEENCTFSFQALVGIILRLWRKLRSFAETEMIDSLHTGANTSCKAFQHKIILPQWVLRIFKYLLNALISQLGDIFFHKFKEAKGFIKTFSSDIPSMKNEYHTHRWHSFPRTSTQSRVLSTAMITNSCWY
jgi:hypothetical protein